MAAAGAYWESGQLVSSMAARSGKRSDRGAGDRVRPACEHGTDDVYTAGIRRVSGGAVGLFVWESADHGVSGIKTYDNKEAYCNGGGKIDKKTKGMAGKVVSWYRATMTVRFIVSV